MTETRTHLDPGPLLRVRVRFGAGSPPGSGATRIDRGRDVVITAPHGATVADVIDAADLPVSGVDWSVINLRSGEIAAPAEPFAVLAPLDGDHLLITDADGAAAYRERGPSTVARHAIEVLSGPASGERYLVRERTCTIGRDDDRADVAITDPSLSREHLRIASDTGGWTIEDLGSRNGSAVDGVALTPGRPTALADGAVIEAGRSTLRFRAGGDAPAERSAPRADGTIGFNTPPRVAPEPFARSHDAPEVPKRAVGPRLPLIASVIPVIAGVVLWRLTDQTLMLAFCLLAPVMAIGTYLSDRMNGRSDFKKLRREFLEAVDELEPEIEAQRAAEHALRLDLYPDAREVVRRMVDGDRRLWERRATHHDDLHLRVGLADQPSEVTLQLPKGGDPELRTHLTEHVPLQPDLPGTPATIDLRERSPVGLAGPDALREGLLRWLVLQVAALHSPRDVQIVALLGEPLRRWDWLKWLPHVPRSGIGTGGAPSIGTTDAAVAEQLAALSDLIRDRAPDGLGAPALNGAPRVVVVVRDEAVRDRSLLGPLLTDTAVQAGVHVLWESSRRDALPSGARTLIELDESRAVGSLVDTVDRSTIREIQIESTPLSVAEEAAAALAPVRDTTHSDRGLASLPAIASLLDLEDARPISAATVEHRWSRAGDSLRFTLGAGPDGPLVIDLVAQGPHALIGGTSGAGKSELLRAALASMALRYPPSQLTFLLVDYKGGSAFRELSELPHSVGVVTDLDEHLSVRALTSLRAEIRHRETILAEHGALDLSDLVRRRPDVAPPRLLIAIDEFATLAQEVPGFVDGVLDVVQRGRSLGVHLVLATQSPRGSVTGKIRANTALSVALRTLSRDESTDIIGTPEAAYIPRRAAGRAWVSLGGTELVPFQSGYVGGAPDAYEEERVEVVPFALGETHDVAGTIAPATEHDTELAALGRAIASAFTAGGDDLPRRPWLPEMPDRLSAAAGLQDHGRGWIGTADDPARQRTFPVVFDPAAHGHLLVLGGPRSGRTSALATTAASLAWGATTDEVQIYGLDGAGRTLGVIEALPHCGAVVTADDGPRTARLLELLTSELATRRARASQLGATDFADLRGRSADPLPRLLLLVDDFGAFSERYERAELGRLADLMRALITDGPAFGLHAVISADRRFAIPAAAQAVIGMRIVLRMTDREEYQRLGLPRAVEALDLPPGRGFDVDGLELQLSTWTREPDEPLRDALARLGSALAERGALASPPAPVRLLPEQIAASALPPADTPWHATIGVRERDLLPAVVDLRAAHFMVVGPYRSGRSTALGALVESLTQATPGLERHLVTNRPSPLADRSGWAAVHTSPTPEELAAVLEQLAAAPAGTPRAVAIDDATELDATMLNTRLEAAVRACRDAGVTILSSCEAQAVFVAYGWLRELRKDGAGLLLSPQMETHGEIFGTKLPWRRAIEFPPGRGFLVRSGGGVELVQVATI